MRRRLLSAFALLAAVGLVAGCSSGEDMNILDAAALYEANEDALNSIRDSYPGPYTEFMRVPARDPAKETRKGKEFIEGLRRSIPVEFVDFFPTSGLGKDEINIMLKRYGGADKWTIISLIYSDMPMGTPPQGSGAAVFDACDMRALEWVGQGRANTKAAAFCKINDNWYAYQQVY